MSNSTTSMIKVDARPAKDYMDRIEFGARRTTSRVLRGLAKDAALLSRARAPHNMDPSTIKWDVVAEGPIIRADGPTAAYDGGELHRTFNHPIFASASIPRNRWNWTGTATTPSQSTYPFIEISAREVAADADLIMSTELQKLFDAEE